MNNRRRWFWFGAAAALAAGLLLRLLFVEQLPRISGDTFVYGAIAKNWLLHGIYGFNETIPTPTHPLTAIRPTLIRLPGYPLFLAACFRLFGMEHYNAVLYVQVAADLLTCLLVSALAGRIFGRRAALPVLWLAAICPFTANYVAAPLTETLVLTTIALAFYALVRWRTADLGYNRWLWVLAAALAYSILLRPEQVLLAVAILPAMLWMSFERATQRESLVRRTARHAARQPLHLPDAGRGRAAAPVLVAALCILLPLIPWAIRNWSTFHVFQPLAPRSATDPDEPSFQGFARWYSTWGVDFASTEDVFWNYDTDRIEPSSLPARTFTLGCLSPAGAQASSGALYAPTVALLDDYNRKATATPAIDARFAGLAAQRIAASPLCVYIALPVLRLLDMLFRPRTEMMNFPLDWWNWDQHPAQTAFAVIYATLNLVYLAFAFAGFRGWKRRAWRGTREIAWAMAAYVILRCILLLTLNSAEPRYTLELFPILFVWAGGLFASPDDQPAQISGELRAL